MSTSSHNPRRRNLKESSTGSISHSPNPSVLDIFSSDSNSVNTGLSIKPDFTLVRDQFSPFLESRRGGESPRRSYGGSGRLAMSLGAHHHAWLPPGHLRPPDDSHHDANSPNAPFRSVSSNMFGIPVSRSQTPSQQQHHHSQYRAASQSANPADADSATQEDARLTVFQDLYRASEARIASLFGPNGETNALDFQTVERAAPSLRTLQNGSVAVVNGDHAGSTRVLQTLSVAPAISRKRKLEEEDYDDDEDEDEEDDAAASASPLKGKGRDINSFFQSATTSNFATTTSRPTPPQTSSSADSAKEAGASQQDPARSADEIRRLLEDDKKATEHAVKRSFNTIFYTLENDRDAMLDQQRLEESERQLEAEMSSQDPSGTSNNKSNAEQPGTLSSANLGASSLTLMNLIARIDQKRSRIQASDAELRSLISEVRKNRSKWANPDKVGQEELYEAAEKVLNELKAMTEHSTAFLTRVNKRDAPDYYSIIKNPMDLGTMTKRLKSIHYKSKQEFVNDLTLIWTNCLKYNSNPEHLLRKHALHMRKETEKLVPLIPDIVIRDRAEVEAEERRAQLAENELEGGEESDDEPIMSSRGRKAPGKKAKKGAPDDGRKTTPGKPGESTPGPDAKLPLQNQILGLQRSDSELNLEGSQSRFATPPPGLGFGSPLTTNLAIQGDNMDVDGYNGSSMNGVLSSMSEHEDPTYKVWKQATKKDRALLAAERHRLFQGDKLNTDEPALVRTRAGMRRFVRNQKLALLDPNDPSNAEADAKEADAAVGETLAEGIEDEDEKMLPDYYDVTSGVPDLSHRLQWVEDSEGFVVTSDERNLRVMPSGAYTAPISKLSGKITANIRQMQETRKICAKIGIVKQMQLQSQMYQNQFQKYQPEPFIEKDIEPHVMSDDGPIMDPHVNRAALQRSIAEIFYHAGFEEYQPSALEAVTDLAANYFKNIAFTFKSNMERSLIEGSPVEVEVAAPTFIEAESKTPPAHSYRYEQRIQDTLEAAGTDLDSLESYIKDDVDRLGTKLGVIHERMKSHLAELLRPALSEGGVDGSQAFNDGSEQFVGGDFAEDIDEDFFGFKELGLDKEFGLATMSVPLHLLQNRMYNAHNQQNSAVDQIGDKLFPTPAPYPRVTKELVEQQIGLIKPFYLAKLAKSNGEPLIEDLELPPKQRPGVHRPRLPATGKIPGPTASSTSNTSPQKRPPPPPTSKSNGTGGAASAGKGAAEASAEGSAKKKPKKNSGAAPLATAADEATNETTMDNSSAPAKSVSKLKLPSARSNASKENNTKASVATDVDAPGDPDMDANGDVEDTLMEGVVVNGITGGGVNGIKPVVTPETIKT